MRGPGEVRGNVLHAILDRRHFRQNPRIYRQRQIYRRSSRYVWRRESSAPVCRSCCGISAKVLDLEQIYVAANFFPLVAFAVHEATTRYLGWEMYAHAG